MDCLFKNATLSFEFSSIVDQARYLSRCMFDREVAMCFNLLTRWLDNTPQLRGVVRLEFFVHLHRFRRYSYYEPIRRWLLGATIARLLPKVKQPVILVVQCSVLLAAEGLDYGPSLYSQGGQIMVDDLDRTEIRLPLDNVEAALAETGTVVSRVRDNMATIASRNMTKGYRLLLGSTGQSHLWEMLLTILATHLRNGIEACVQEAAAC